MDYIKLAQRTISMLNSMIESGECHTTRTREMVNNIQNGLDQLRQYKYNVVGRSEQLPILDRCECEEPNEEPIKVCMNCNGYVE